MMALHTRNAIASQTVWGHFWNLQVKTLLFVQATLQLRSGTLSRRYVFQTNHLKVYKCYFSLFYCSQHYFWATASLWLNLGVLPAGYIQLADNFYGGSVYLCRHKLQNEVLTKAKALFHAHVYFPSCHRHSSGVLLLSLLTILCGHIQPSGCSWPEYKGVLQVKSLEHIPSKSNYFSSIILLLCMFWTSQRLSCDQSISLRNAKLGQSECLQFTAHGCGKDRQGRNKEQVKME